jgi:predicted regulator of Ras-like GTPase activity (Roadblock/LC7/MglB family)
MSAIEQSLQELMQIEGTMGAAIVDYGSGMTLGSSGSGVDLELAGAGNSEVVKAKMSTMESLGIEGQIDDILITLDTQMHVIRPTSKHDNLFIYLVLDKKKANLALARRKVHSVEDKLEI